MQSYELFFVLCYHKQQLPHKGLSLNEPHRCRCLTRAPLNQLSINARPTGAEKKKKRKKAVLV